MQKTAMGPTLRWATQANCRIDGRHDVTATPEQLQRLSVVVAPPAPEWRYCHRCCAVFDADGREIPPESV
jgi:hypothetical protein